MKKVSTASHFVRKFFSISMVLASIGIVFTMVVQPAKAQFYPLPGHPDPAARYVFFLHNYYVEQFGPDQDCEYREIMATFQKAGFHAVGELRTGEESPSEYAAKVAGQVETLIGKGVPPESIIVSGHSKGAVIALIAASLLENPHIRYVIMAGCGIGPLADAYPDFKLLKGRFLSIREASDHVAGPCKEKFPSSAEGLSVEQVVVTDAGKGHRLFFKPEKSWTEPVLDWMLKKENP